MSRILLGPFKVRASEAAHNTPRNHKGTSKRVVSLQHTPPSSEGSWQIANSFSYLMTDSFLNYMVNCNASHYSS